MHHVEMLIQISATLGVRVENKDNLIVVVVFVVLIVVLIVVIFVLVGVGVNAVSK